MAIFLITGEQRSGNSYNSIKQLLEQGADSIILHPETLPTLEQLEKDKLNSEVNSDAI